MTTQPLCNHDTLIDTGLDYFHCLSCNKSWTKDEFNKLLATTPHSGEGRSKEQEGYIIEKLIEKHKTTERRQSNSRLFGGYDFDYIDLHNAKLMMEEYASQSSSPLREDGWVKVEDGKHPFGELVLVSNCEYKWIATAKCIHHKWEMDDKHNTIIKPTHWQPLPQPPVEGEQNDLPQR